MALTEKQYYLSTGRCKSLYQVREKELDKSTQEKMWFFIDTILRDFKAKQAYSS